MLAAAPGVPTVPGAPVARSAEKPISSQVVQQGLGSARPDPGRAARLFTTAEHIANSITDKLTKVSALDIWLVRSSPFTTGRLIKRAPGAKGQTEPLAPHVPVFSLLLHHRYPDRLAGR